MTDKKARYGPLEVFIKRLLSVTHLQVSNFTIKKQALLLDG
jgi:hypothetical protein